jgi:hypothetical protein
VRRVAVIGSLLVVAACAGQGSVPEPSRTAVRPAPSDTPAAAVPVTSAPPPPAAACPAAERVAGTAGRWTPATLPDDVAAASGTLTAVSAADAGTAWAVGHTGPALPGPASRPLALSWDGVTWARRPVPDRPGGLVSVASVDTRTAWAVGTEPGATRGERSHLLRWDGSSWQDAWPAPESGISSSARLRQVATDGCGRVYLVGADRETPLVAQWDGDAWQRLPFPGQPGGGSEVRLVSARPGTRVWVGVSGAGDAHGILSWDGRTWRTERLVGGSHVGLHALTVIADDQVWYVSNQPWVGGPVDRPAPPGPVFATTVSGSGPSPSTLGWTAVTDVSGHASPEWVAGTAGLARWDGRRWAPVPGGPPRGFHDAAFAPVPGTGETWLVASAAPGPSGPDAGPPLLFRFTPDERGRG